MGTQKIEIEKNENGIVIMYASMFTKITPDEMRRFVNALKDAIYAAESWQTAINKHAAEQKAAFIKKREQDNAAANTDRGEPPIEHLRDMRKPRGRPPKNSDEPKQEAAGV